MPRAACQAWVNRRLPGQLPIKKFSVIRRMGGFTIIEIADDGSTEPVVNFPTERMALEWLGRNQALLQESGATKGSTEE